MSPFTDDYQWLTETRYLGPAQVLEVEASEPYVRVQRQDACDSPEIRARKAISGQLFPGDSVLILGEDPDNSYIIGILQQSEKEVPSSTGMILEGGTHAIRNGRSLSVFSRKKELIFQYDENSGKARVNLESGDIDFVTQKGNINFISGQDIILNGQTVGITGRSGTVVGALDSRGKITSAVSVKDGQLHFQSPTIEIESQNAEMKIEKTSFTGKKFTAEIGMIRVLTDRLESVVKTVISRAQNVYRTVEELYQLKAGRMRTLISHTFHLKSKRSMLKSEEDFKINAEQIHLG